jgi:hypothetical protein
MLPPLAHSPYIFVAAPGFAGGGTRPGASSKGSSCVSFEKRIAPMGKGVNPAEITFPST